jgi:2-oxo-3-hexenedioate decarboxylase
MRSEAAAAELSRAARELKPIPAFSGRGEGFDIAQAYDIQWLVVQERLRSGERLMGAKIGLTSLAKQRQLGLDAPVYGWLTDRMRMRSGGRIELGDHIHPRVEPEIGFLLGGGLSGECTAARVRELTSAVFPAFEIVDSRYEGFKFGMADVIADNTSAAGVVLGEPLPLAGLDLPAIACSLRVNGVEVATARGEAVLGDPANAVAWLSGELARAGRSLPAGSMVLSGSLTDFVPLRAGDRVEAVFESLGQVRIEVAD